MRTPKEIKRKGSEGLEILWAEGLRTALDSEYLRRNCPCAECREARGDSSHAKPLTAKKSSLRIIDASKKEQISLNSIWAVGNYAIGLSWADSHDTGIYTFDYLWELAKATDSAHKIEPTTTA